MVASRRGRKPPSVNRLLVLTFLTVAACDGGQASTIVAGTDNGLIVLRQTLDSRSELQPLDGVERHGTFQFRDGCIVLSTDGSDDTPVFTNRNAERSALSEVRDRPPGGQSQSWEIFGEALAPDRQRVAPACGKPLFLLLGIHPSASPFDSTPARPLGSGVSD